MKRLLLLIAGICSFHGAFATAVPTVTVNIAASTTVTMTSTVQATYPGGAFVNNGTYTDNAGSFNIGTSGMAFSGSGTTTLNDLSFNTSFGTSVFNSVVTVGDVCTITAGAVNANGNLTLGSGASLVNNGSLTGTVLGLRTNATVTSGGCPSFTSVLSLNVSGTRMKYQWSSSADNSTFTPITGATNATYTPTVTTTTYYRCDLTTNNTAYAQSTPGTQLTFTGTYPTITLGTSPTVTQGATTANLPYTATTGSPVNYSVAWGSAAGTEGFTPVTSASLTATPIVLAVPAAAAAAVYSGTLTVTNGCVSTGYAFTVNVVTDNTGPVFAGGSPQSLPVCENSGATAINTLMTVSDPDGGQTETWTIASGPSHGTLGGFSTTQPSGTATITPTGLTYTPTSSYSGTDMFVIQVSDGSATALTTVNVIITPIPASIAGTALICVSGSTSLSDATSGGNWTSSAPGIAGVTSAGLVSGGSSGTATITYSTGCAPDATIIITVNPIPTAAPVSNGDICSGGSTILFAIPTNGASSFSWTGPSGYSSSSQDPVIAPTVTGTYSLTVSSGNESGCSPAAMYTVSVSVNPMPVASVSNNGPACSGVSVTLNATPAGGTSAYSWAGPGGFSSTDQNPVVTPTASGTYSLSVSSGTGSGCTPLIVYTTSVTINPLPVTIAGVRFVCEGGATTTLSDAITGGTWSSNSPSIASIGSSSGIVTGNITGTTTITYTTAGGCYTTAVVTVNLAPTAINGTAALCQGTTTSLSNAIGGGLWSSLNGAVASVGSSSGIVTGVGGGTAIIIYDNGCGTNATQTVTVTPIPAAISGVATVCISSGASLSDITPGGNWTSSAPGVVSVTTTGSINGESVGTAIISYSTGCGTAATKTITVTDVPADISGATSTCQGLTTALSDAVTGGVWNSDAPGVASVNSSTGVVTGVSLGTATISYNTGCGTAATQVMTVNSIPAITGTGTLCAGATVVLSDPAGAGTWVSSNTSVATTGSSSGVVTGISGGTANITYINASGCQATTIVTVGPIQPINGSTSICMGAPVTLTDISTGGTWSIDNTSVATIGSSSGVVTSVGAGSANITYALPSGCSRTIVFNVGATTPVSGTTIMCHGVSSTLSNATGGGQWSSTNSLIASVGSSSGVMTGTGTGTTTISYTIGSCITTSVVTINPNPLPIQGGTSECLGSTLVLSDNTAGGVWSSSNANATVASGSITGAVVGTSTISYTLASGCYTTYANTILPNPSPILGSGVVCMGASIILSDTTAGATSWTSSTPSVATTVNSGQVTAVSIGTSTITYKISTGCIVTTIITVLPLPGAITGSTPVCTGNAITLSDPAGAGTWTSATTTIATIGSSSGVVTGAAAGTSRITYIAASTGCAATAIATVNSVLPISGNANLVSGSMASISDASAGGTWLSTNTSVVTVSSTGTLTGVSVGSALISYTTAAGCSSTITVTVNAPSPIMGLTGALCQRVVASLSNSTPGGIWSSSNAGIASVNGLGVVTASSVNTGTATVSYTVGGWSATTIVTVNLLPNPIQGLTSHCMGTVITLTDATAGGTWSSNNSNESVVGAGGTSTVTGLAAGTNTITYQLNNGCFATYPMTVHSNPTAILGNTNACMGSTTTFSDATTGTLSWTSSTTGVATIINSGVLTPVSLGTTTITYKVVTGSCYITKVITVNAIPVVTAIQGGASISHATPATLSDATSGGIWSSSNASIIALGGSTGSPVTATAITSSGSAVISYAVTNVAGCKTTVTKTITATLAPPHHGGSTAVEPAITAATEVQLYPNPTSGTINIKADVAGKFYLYALDGKTLNEYKVAGGITTIALPNELAKGIYMGRYVGDDGKTALFKIVKE